jgi:hypothetical protein
MTEMLGVLSETSRDARADTGPVVLTFRAWNPRVESWDDYVGALERVRTVFGRLSPYDQGGADRAGTRTSRASPSRLRT